MATGAFRAQHRNDSRRDSNKCGKDMKAEHGQDSGESDGISIPHRLRGATGIARSALQICHG